MAEIDLNTAQFDEPHPSGGSVIDLNNASFDQPQDQGYLSRVSSDISARMDKAANAPDFSNFMISSARIGLGGAQDIASEALKSGYNSLSDSVTQPINNYVSSVVNSPSVKNTLDSAKNLSMQYPTVSNALGMAAEVPVGAGATRVANAASKEAGDAMVESGMSTLAKRRAQFAQDLVAPIMNKSEAEDAVSRTTQQGLFNKKVIQPTLQEQQAAAEVAKIPTVSKSNTLQGNYNAIRAEIGAEATRLKSALDKEGTNFMAQETTDIPKTTDQFGNVIQGDPVQTPAVNKFHAVLDNAVNDIAANETLSGNARTAAAKIANKMHEFVDANEPTASGLLTARQQFDKWLKQSRAGQTALEPDFQNGLSAATRAVRQTTNDFIAANTASADVKASLAKQSSLYRALDNIGPKAAKEAPTAVGRANQKLEQILHTRSAIAKGAATGAAVAGLGTTAVMAPWLLPTAGAAYGAGKVALSPQTRLAIGKILQTMGK